MDSVDNTEPETDSSRMNDGRGSGVFNLSWSFLGSVEDHTHKAKNC